jgi:hypothetical protein
MAVVLFVLQQPLPRPVIVHCLLLTPPLLFNPPLPAWLLALLLFLISMTKRRHGAAG